MYNFDEIIERQGTNALKTDVLEERYGRADLTPLWVADMDFKTPDFILDALRERLNHPILGYTVEPKEYWESIINWVRDHHQWEVKREWLTYIPGVVKGIGAVINAVTKPDEKVIIQPPVYHPFRYTTLGNKRPIVYNPLKKVGEGYEMDFENLEKVVDEKCHLLVLSNPHNPAGIVWSKETLVKLADFCYDHNIIVISDEIHCDLALWENKHIPFATVSEKANKIAITFAAPTKTFNIAGVVSSYAIVPNDELRSRFFGWLIANELNEPHLFAPIATTAAFTKGEEWRKEMLRYIEGNIDYVIDYLRDNIPAIKPLRPQASFLVWLDCKALGLKHDELVDLFVNKAHLALNDGEIFGIGGEGHMRLNVGSPRAILEKALKQLKEAVEQTASNKSKK
ncbi:MAG: PatB family C-S lyase [Bacteroidales bacterium]|nr:PatB family C-S lyase [Bacteroidales bacterium]